MERKTTWLLVAALMLGSSMVSADEVIQPGQADVRVTDIVAAGHKMTAEIENHSDLVVRNPRILIRHAWLWKDEFNPGTDNPGRSEVVTIPAEIPPGGSFVFSHELPAAYTNDQRGHFMTSVEIVGFEQVGRRPVSSSMR